jgi:hypothetical protein
MPSEVQVASAALLRLGEKPITLLSESELATATFGIHRDALIRAHPWNFAMREASLPADATSPTWKYDYAYPLPVEPTYCLRVWAVNNPNEYEWQVLGRKIFTDLGAPLEIVHLWRVKDPEQWDANFVEAMIAKLAMEWAQPLVKDGELVKEVTDEFNKKIDTAFGIDGQEGTTEPVPEGSWVEANR